MTLWKKVYFYYSQESDLSLLETWEREYWMTVRAHTTLFPKAEPVLKSLAEKYRVALITNTQGQQGYGTHRMHMFPETGAVF